MARAATKRNQGATTSSWGGSPGSEARTQEGREVPRGRALLQPAARAREVGVRPARDRLRLQLRLPRRRDGGRRALRRLQLAGRALVRNLGREPAEEGRGEPGQPGRGRRPGVGAPARGSDGRGDRRVPTYLDESRRTRIALANLAILYQTVAGSAAANDATSLCVPRAWPRPGAVPARKRGARRCPRLVRRPDRAGGVDRRRAGIPGRTRPLPAANKEALGVLKKLAKLSPNDSSALLRYAQAAEGAGPAEGGARRVPAVRQAFPDDTLVPDAKARIRALEKQASAIQIPTPGDSDLSVDSGADAAPVERLDSPACARSSPAGVRRRRYRGARSRLLARCQPRATRAPEGSRRAATPRAARRSSRRSAAVATRSRPRARPA